MKKFLFVILLMTGSDLLWGQETTIYVASEMVRCKGMLEVMCYQIKESSEKDYDIFIASIDGFTFEEGYEYELLVYKGYHESPPSTAPAAYYSLKKILSKKLPNETLEIANRMSTCEDTKIFDCLLYKRKGEKEWHNLYGKIKGFKYKKGYDYELLVSKKLNNNMGAGRTYEYTLIKTLSKKPTMVISGRNKDELDGKKFALTGYRVDGKYEENTTDKQANISFRLDENQTGGNDGCNTFFGRVEINGSKISFGMMGSTKMACQGVRVDKIIYENLSKVNRYKVSNGNLKLYSGKTLLLEYSLLMEDVLPEKKQ